jgi:hypothetical protein
MMTGVFKLRITIIWLLLVLMTCLSWEAVQGMGWLADPRIAASTVMIVAFVKARFILLDFMELRDAPLPLRLFAEAWVTIVCLAILAMYWTHSRA